MNTNSLHGLTARGLLAAGLTLTLTAGVAASPLDATWEAHGGLDRWSEQKRLSYTMDGFPLTAEVAERSRSTVDLQHRKNRIESSGYVTGWDGERAWVEPAESALGGLPARFYNLGSFYFAGVPFVFGDPGVVVTDAGEGTFDGRTYRVIHIGYEDGVGHSAEDDYQLYIDPETDLVAVLNHSVTETGVERVTWVYESYTEVDGLLLPAKLTFYPGWNPSDPGEGASYEISGIDLGTELPDANLYEAPSGAEIVE
ncbi:DUF6503 family protein [Mucisphaera sp.]|uniref:DUF6503 family protein n=1 Tax=Mucisphaera sp. TaxID=2913024 RepID=UPI003D118AFC